MGLFPGFLGLFLVSELLYPPLQRRRYRRRYRRRSARQFCGLDTYHADFQPGSDALGTDLRAAAARHNQASAVKAGRRYPMGVNSQPALRGQFSTGLDIARRSAGWTTPAARQLHLDVVRFQSRLINVKRLEDPGDAGAGHRSRK